MNTLPKSGPFLLLHPVYNDKKWNQKNMKECDKRNSHKSNKLNMIYISSNNVRHPVTKTFTTSLHFTQLHFTPLHYNCRHFTSSHLNFTQLHFTDTNSTTTWNYLHRMHVTLRILKKKSDNFKLISFIALKCTERDDKFLILSNIFFTSSFDLFYRAGNECNPPKLFLN